jgi:hypothetical protein
MKPGICYALTYPGIDERVPVPSRAVGEAIVDLCRAQGVPVPVLGWSFVSEWQPISEAAA